MRKQYAENLRRLQADRYKAVAPPPPQASWKEKLAHLQEQRKVPPPPTFVRGSVPLTPKTIAIVAHGFDAHDGLSKVAGSLIRGFKEIGWRVTSVIGWGPWWERVPPDTEVTLIAVFPNAISEPMPNQIPGRLVRYTMFEHPRVPPEWVEVLNRAEHVYVTLPEVALAMERSGVRATVESIGFGWEHNFPHAFVEKAPRLKFGCLSVAGRRKGMLELVEGFRIAKEKWPDITLHVHSRVLSEPDYTQVGS